MSAAQTTQAAQGLTLSNFGLITSTGVPLGCILTYNSVLTGCRNSDFTQGSTCSSACLNGIRAVQRAVLTACDQVSAPDNSVLGQALAGNLVELLCPGPGATTSSPSKNTSTVMTATTSTTVPTTLSKVTLTPVASSTVTPSRTETLATDIPTYSPPGGPSGPPPPPPPAPTQPTATQPAPESAEPTERVLGGGSPFDAIVSSKASGHLASHPVSACLVGLVLSLLLAR
ncbi:hypothetical protein QBC34DRAFT_373975 [Podospora aff. communis PSN243]|uniref:Extracellular membrane protein CFEM domain-containing protein n=1 Tax=Podospora aff. communis PSN243 TaxID=3040156 RepID=A0AAV9H8H6_9PEZI|nr:hypothetical protein QBC34DRAFT_373975 [Podospora aff. communis PSN243]